MPVFLWNVNKLVLFSAFITSICLFLPEKVSLCVEEKIINDWNYTSLLGKGWGERCSAQKGREEPWALWVVDSLQQLLSPWTHRRPCSYSYCSCYLVQRHKGLVEGETKLGLDVCSGEIFLICYLSKGVISKYYQEVDISSKNLVTNRIL